MPRKPARFIDTNHNQESSFVRYASFTGADERQVRPASGGDCIRHRISRGLFVACRNLIPFTEGVIDGVSFQAEEVSGCVQSALQNPLLAYEKAVG